MTRSHRAIQLAFACLLLTFASLSPIAASPAEAGILDFLKSATQPADTAAAQPDADNDSDDDTVAGASAAIPTAPAAAKTDTTGSPTVEWSKHLYCVQYARLRSGMQIFGDAKYWWDRAADLYSRATQPVADAVMVFSGSKRITHGHVAVVTAVLSPREIKVDHANWQNQGEIDLNMPVLDVSQNNDWSQVRVWDPGSNQFGARIYAISGFIARPAQTAANGT